MLRASAQGQPRPPPQARTLALPGPPTPGALAALTIGVSPHPQGGASSAGQPGGVGRVRVRGWVPAQLGALQGGAAGDHEVRGQVSRAAAGWVDPGEFHEVLAVPAHYGGGQGWGVGFSTADHLPSPPPHPVAGNLRGSSVGLEGNPGSGGPPRQRPPSQQWPRRWRGELAELPSTWTETPARPGHCILPPEWASPEVRPGSYCSNSSLLASPRRSSHRRALSSSASRFSAWVERGPPPAAWVGNGRRGESWGSQGASG